MERDTVYLLQRSTCCQNLKMFSKALVNCQEGNIKPDAQPVQHPPRAVPEKKKEAYKDELERLCSLGIIEPVAGHTDWINSIVPIAKPDGSI